MDIKARDRLINTITNELPVLRAKLNISQEDLSKAIGISRQTYSLIETKKHKMSWTIFMALLAFFENNKNSLSQLSTIGFFDGDDFSNCITIKQIGGN